jgi:DNA invertase Pin-like site-specific DNA recombinase
LEKGSLAQFLGDVNNGRIKTPSVLIVEQLDRLTRTRLRDARKLFEGLLEKGVQICTANNGKIYTDKSLDEPTDLFMSLMELKAANEYSANLGRRVAAARQRNRDGAASPDRKRWTAMCPQWLTLDKARNEFVINQHVKTILKIFNDYANGKGIRRIVIALNSQIDKYPAARKRWSTVHVRRLLSDRAVLGEYQPMIGGVNEEKKPAGEPILNYYPAVIEKPVFYKVQERLKANKAPGRYDERVTNLFKNQVRCKHCGGSMVIKWDGNKEKGYISNLVCSNGFFGGSCPKDWKRIRYAYIERAVLTSFWQHIIPAMGDGDNKAEKLIGLQGDLKVTKDRLAKAMEDYAETISPTIKKVITTLEAKEKELTKQMEETTAFLQDNPFTEWKQMPETTDNRLRLKAILSDTIKEITIDAHSRKATLTLKDADHKPLQLAWDAMVSNASRVKPAQG